MNQSQSFVSFKARTQEIFDFAVLVSISVPVLKQNLKLFKEGKIDRLPDPDYFEPSVVYEITDTSISLLLDQGLKKEKLANLEEIKGKPLNNREYKEKVIKIIGEEDYKKYRNILKRQASTYVNNIESCTQGYKQKLATYLYFSTFSYFEYYINDVCKEMVSSSEKIKKDDYILNHPISSETERARKRLNHKYNPQRLDQYKNTTNELKGAGYIEPKEILFSTLIDNLNEKLKDLKANEIPVFLEKSFMYKFTKFDLDTFHSIRANRNSIGHGDHTYSPSLKDVIETNKFLKSLSSKIDKHIVFHFKPLANYIS